MNVVLIVTDDQEIDTINADAMPYLAGEPHGHWVMFPNSRQSTPWCGPCRANLLTGQRSDHNDVTNNDTEGIDPDECVNVAVQNTGAVTGCFGKWINHYDSTAIPAGWDDWWILHTGDGFGGLHYFEGWTATNSAGVEEDEGDYPGEYVTDIIVDKAAAFIAANAADPFFCYVAFTAPHHPATPAARHAAATFDLADPPDWNQAPTNGPSWLTGLSAMTAGEQTTTRNLRVDAHRTLLAVDEGVETIIDALDTAAVLDDTLVIFCTDNAIATGRKRIGDNVRNISKTSPYRYANTGLLRVRHPDATARVDHRLVDFLDLPATILDIFDATPIVTPEGGNLLPIILDTPDTPWRQVAYSCYVGTEPTVAIPKWRAIRWGNWRYATYYEVDEVELYDLATDPHETVNVAADHPDLVAKMQGWIDDITAAPLAAFDIAQPGTYAMADSQLAEASRYVVVDGELVEA